MAIDSTSTTVTSAPIPTAKRSLYESSTQYKHWRFSSERLAEIRDALNSAATEAIRKTFEADSPGSSEDVEFLSAEEEHLLVKLYLGRVANTCMAFRFPEEVEATAASYLKRFYLKNTVMDWHPRNVMLTVVFLATKTTNHPISLDEYVSKIPNTSPSHILDLEFLVAQSLGFEFAVWHAHRALWGLWLDLQSLPDVSTELSQDIYDAAFAHMRASRLTDAELIFSPSQIALACLSLCSSSLATRWAQSKFPPDSLVHQTLQSTTDAIKILIAEGGHQPDVESVRAVDRRLKLCKNPEKVVGSRAYLKKKEEEERKAEEKRTRKAEEARRSMEEGDPFGTVLKKEEPVAADEEEDED